MLKASVAQRESGLDIKGTFMTRTQREASGSSPARVK